MQILVAVLLGILAGVVLGPLSAGLQPISVAFSMLLQTSVLPYICFSIIQGLGCLMPAKGKKTVPV